MSVTVGPSKGPRYKPGGAPPPASPGQTSGARLPYQNTADSQRNVYLLRWSRDLRKGRAGGLSDSFPCQRASGTHAQEPGPNADNNMSHDETSTHEPRPQLAPTSATLPATSAVRHHARHACRAAAQCGRVGAVRCQALSWPAHPPVCTPPHPSRIVHQNSVIPPVPYGLPSLSWTSRRLTAGYSIASGTGVGVLVCLCRK
jgi:hypothetical protein